MGGIMKKLVTGPSGAYLLVCGVASGLLGACAQPSSSSNPAAAAAETQAALDENRDQLPHINLMAPLGVHDSAHPEDRGYDWDAFNQGLDRAYRNGVRGISVDMWWNSYQPNAPQEDGAGLIVKSNINWEHYVKVAEAVVRHGLKFVPIFSFHTCDANECRGVGGDRLPDWVWDKVAARMGGAAGQGGSSREALRYLGEQGETSDEYLPVWATEHAVPYYRAAMDSFRDEFIPALQAKLTAANLTVKATEAISEINISLGPSGELRYPSYGGDGERNFKRGSLMAFSKIALADLEKTNADLKSLLPSGDQRGAFYDKIKSRDPKALAVMHWYSQSLNNHADKIVRAAFQAFAGPEFANVDIGVKIAGVKWGIGWATDSSPGPHLMERFAEMTAGVIDPTAGSLNDGTPYLPLLQALKNAAGNNPRLVVHFTAIEEPDCRNDCGKFEGGGAFANAMPHTLVGWFAQVTTGQRIRLKGENAGTNYEWYHFNNIKDFLKNSCFEGVTMLRLDSMNEGGALQNGLANLDAEKRDFRTNPSNGNSRACPILK